MFFLAWPSLVSIGRLTNQSQPRPTTRPNQPSNLGSFRRIAQGNEAALELEETSADGRAASAPPATSDGQTFTDEKEDSWMAPRRHLDLAPKPAAAKKVCSSLFSLCHRLLCTPFLDRPWIFAIPACACVFLTSAYPLPFSQSLHLTPFVEATRTSSEAERREASSLEHRVGHERR